MSITEVINEIFSAVVYHYIAVKTHDKNYYLQCFDVNVYIHFYLSSLIPQTYDNITLLGELR